MSTRKKAPVAPVRGRDVDAPVKYVTFDGQRYPMVFNNRAARITEDIYEEKYGRDIGYYGVLAEVEIPKHRAIMAMVYASIAASGAEISWEDFEANFKLTDIEGVAQAIQAGVIQSLPDEDPDADPDEKNAKATPTEE